MMCRTVTLGLTVMLTALGLVRPAVAQSFDVTIFTGRAYPIYDERLTLTPGTPRIPGVEVTVSGNPILRADGGPVFGAAVAFETGLFALEGRLDATDVALAFSGARYDLRGAEPPFQDLSASLIGSAGRFEADRIMLLSLNGRLRTPGPVGLVASGGVSYLPDIRITGAVPLALHAPGVPLIPTLDAGLTLRATPGTAGHRFGVNGGAGIRAGGRLGIVAEARAFYFREYELRFGTQGAPDLLDELLAGLAPVRFRPIFVNAQAGLVLRF